MKLKKKKSSKKLKVREAFSAPEVPSGVIKKHVLRAGMGKPTLKSELGRLSGVK